MRRLLALAVVAVPVVVAVLAVFASQASAQKAYTTAFGQPAPLPKYETGRSALPLLDDDAHKLLTHLNNDFDGTQQSAAVSSEDIDVFAGASALRVGLPHRHSARITNWNFKIAEKPKTDEYRYVRFAWKKSGGTGVMLRLHDPNRGWVAHYYAGKNVTNYQPSVEVSKEVPTEWAVVTRDLFKDFGVMTVSGVGFAPMDGQYALFDHLAFGKSVSDLDAATEVALGRGRPGTTLEPKYREALWEDLFERDHDRAGLAVRQFLATAPDAVGFIGERLKVSEQKPEDVRNRTKRIAALVGSLGVDADFDTRLAATEELEKLGTAAEPAIRTAQSSPDPETRYRAARLLARLKMDNSEASLAGARAGRVVRILERAGTAEAKGLLKSMADGTYGSEYLDPAAAALGRLK